jgi:Protein of unknown function (DUF4239)
MIEFLRRLTPSGMLIVLGFVMIAAGIVQWLLRRKRINFWFRSDSAVDNYLQMLTVFYGLLLGLAAIDLWQKKDDAVKNTTNEANQIRILADLARSLPGDKTVLIASLADYTQGVIKKEWPMMLANQQREMFVASPELDNVRSAIMEMEPKTSAEQAAFQETVSRYGQIVEARQRRLLDSERELPDVLRMTLIIGTFFTLLTVFFIASKHLHTQVLLAAVSGGYLFLLLYVVLILEHPFIGDWSVRFTPYERVLEILH